jgi:hypothetical protein
VESGNGAVLTVTVEFNQQSFAGTKNLYAYALSNEQVSSGYQLAGTWTVPRPVTRRPPAPGGSLGLSIQDYATAQIRSAAQLTPQ